MELSELILESKIDFTNCLVEKSGGTRLESAFDVSPLEFVSFSKADLREGGKRGVINAATNAKRAIDCQVDKVFKCFGYQFDDFPNYLKDFCEYFCECSNEDGLHMKLKVINAFGMAPAGLVSEVRLLRNKLEHYYSVPTVAEVRKAIEISELFVTATEKKLLDYWDFELTDYKRRVDSKLDGRMSGLSISKRGNSGPFTVKNCHPSGEGNSFVDVDIENESYPVLMRMCISLDQEEEVRRSLLYLLKINNHRIPEEKVNVSIEN